MADTIPETWSNEYGGAIRQHPIKGKDACNLLGAYKEDVVLHINSTQYFGPLKMYCYGCANSNPVMKQTKETVSLGIRCMYMIPGKQEYKKTSHSFVVSVKINSIKVHVTFLHFFGIVCY